MYKYDLIFELECTKRKIEKLVNKIDLNLSICRKGSLFIKDGYAYIKFYEDKKMKSVYIGKNLENDVLNNIRRELSNRKVLKKRKAIYLDELKEINRLLDKYRKER